MNNILTDVSIQGRPILSLHKFNELAGITATTTWRWRRLGCLVTVNIAGRQYITDKGLTEFMRRVEAGDFAKEHKAPKRRD
jgi:hypothetical protein